MKTIVWGIGKYYLNRKNELNADPRVRIIAFCDNNAASWGEMIDGIQVIPPKLIENLKYDVILIMSRYVREIQEQLIGLGVDSSKIIFWELFHAELLQGKREIIQGNYKEIKECRKILIISTHLDYNGGSIAAVYAATVLRNRKYNVVLAAPGGNKKFIEEIANNGIAVAIWQALPYIYDQEKEWIKEFDIVVVNVLQMLQSAYISSEIKPTLWWIHESSWMYNEIMSMPWNSIEENKLNDINICAVSSLAQINFNKHFSNRIKEILAYGIPDMVSGKKHIQDRQFKTVFAIIGGICEGKAQDIFAEAARMISHKEQAEFWIIGQSFENPFNEKLKEIISGIPSIKLIGVLSREEIYNIFPRIDVVVCASREDSLPIVMTEGMMFGKVCITTDKAGTADYIKDGMNGFIIPAGNVDALKMKMEWIIDNVEKLEPLRIAARKTYEEYFSMDAFGERLEKALMETEEKWQAEHSTKL